MFSLKDSFDEPYDSIRFINVLVAIATSWPVSGFHYMFLGFYLLLHSFDEPYDSIEADTIEFLEIQRLN